MRSNMKDKFKLLKNGLKIGAAVAAMALAVCVGNTSVAYADDTYTVDGGIKWTITGDILKIESAGDKLQAGYTNGVMNNYEKFTSDDSSSDKAPWSKDANYDKVKRIEISDDVSVIGNRAFGGLTGSKALDAVVIGSGVKSIGEYAFANTKINELTVYTSDMTCNENSFLSKKDGTSEITDGSAESEYKISHINCYPKVNASIVGNNNTISVTNFNIKIESDNLLADKADVSIKWDGLSTSQTAEKATLSISPSKLALFTDKSMDLAKLKFFTLSQTDENAPINKAQITIPTPSDWKDNHDKIELYSYTISDNTLTLNKLGSAISDANIVFTGEGFPVNYVLYYNYNSNPEYKVLIDTQYFDNEVFYWGIAGGSLTYGIPTKTDTTISELISKFAASNTANSSGYTIDNNKLKVFDLSLTVDGTTETTAPSNMRVKVPVPDGWEASDVQVLTLSSENKITAINSTTVTYIGSKLYVDFMPSHFSPYALYNAKAGTETTTATTTAAATTTTAVSTTTRANTVSTTNSNYNNSSTSYNGTGKYDNTPKTGVKDFMWIAVPAAVMLMGTGMVILGRRKQKSIDE